MVEQRQEIPLFSPERDGNVFEWVLQLVQTRRAMVEGEEQEPPSVKWHVAKKGK